MVNTASKDMVYAPLLSMNWDPISAQELDKIAGRSSCKSLFVGSRSTWPCALLGMVRGSWQGFFLLLTQCILGMAQRYFRTNWADEALHVQIQVLIQVYSSHCSGAVRVMETVGKPFVTFHPRQLCGVVRFWCTSNLVLRMISNGNRGTSMAGDPSEASSVQVPIWGHRVSCIKKVIYIYTWWLLHNNSSYCLVVTLYCLATVNANVTGMMVKSMFGESRSFKGEWR